MIDQPDATFAGDRDEWLATIGRLGDAVGYFQPLGARHWALYAARGTTLLVTFDTLDSARTRPGQLPQGFALARARGWTSVCVIADGPTWYRDPAVFRYFDRLVDDAFFEGFSQVVFYGAGAAGFAACAYAVAAAGATVLALAPRAGAPADGHARYADATQLIAGAGKVFILCDPYVAEDSAHAAAFVGPNVTHLAARCIGEAIEARLNEMSVLPDLIVAAAEGWLDREAFARIWRKRRDHPAYLAALRAKADARGIRSAPGVGGPGAGRPAPSGPTISQRLAALAASRTTKP